VCRAIRLLRASEGIDIIVTGALEADFEEDRDTVLLKMVEECVRKA